jgi:NDP-sugar pyrophosphorylase family protein
VIGLILAGGFAKRLGPIGRVLPKPLLMVEGDRAINHLIRKLKAAGVLTIYITVNRKFATFFDRYENLIIEPAVEEEEKLGAVSAIANAIEQAEIDDDLVVVCADNYFSSGFEEFIQHFTGEPMVGLYYAGTAPDLKPEEMATVLFDGSESYPPPSKTPYLKDFKEKVSPPLSNYVGTGVYVLPKRVFPVLMEFCRGRKRDAPGYFIQHLMERGEKIKAYVFGGEWYDISHKTYWSLFREADLELSDDRCVRVSKTIGPLKLELTILKPKKAIELHTASINVVLEGVGESQIGEKKRTVRPRDVIVVRGERGSIKNGTDLDLVFLSVCSTKR